MAYSERIKPVSCLKANAAQMLRTMNEDHKPIVITQNGEARTVLQDFVSYEAIQETLALLKLVALARGDIAAGRAAPADAVIDRLRTRHYDDE